LSATVGSGVLRMAGSQPASMLADTLADSQPAADAER